MHSEDSRVMLTDNERELAHLVTYDVEIASKQDVQYHFVEARKHAECYTMWGFPKACTWRVDEIDEKPVRMTEGTERKNPELRRFLQLMNQDGWEVISHTLWSSTTMHLILKRVKE